MKKFFNEKIKAVLFDCYGTIIDTGNSSIKATKEILSKHYLNIEAEEFYSRWKVYQRKYFDDAGNFLNQEEIFFLTLKELYEEYHINGNPAIDVKIMLNVLGKRTAFPESARVISLLKKKYKVYIASISDNEPIFNDLSRNNITVDEVFTSESLMVYKPDKHFFYEVLNRINLQAHEVIYIGDSPDEDIAGPMSIGIKAVWVNRKNRALDTELHRPDFIVKNLEQLLNYFAIV